MAQSGFYGPGIQGIRIYVNPKDFTVSNLQRTYWCNCLSWDQL